MKKTRIFALALALSLTLSLALTACGGNSKPAAKDVPVADLYEAVAATQELPFFADLTDDDLDALYGMDPALLVEYVAKVPMMNAQASEVFIAKVQSGKMDDVKKCLEDRQAALVEQWSWYLPAQLELVENYKLVTVGDYVLFCVCEDSDAMVTAFENALK